MEQNGKKRAECHEIEKHWPTIKTKNMDIEQIKQNGTECRKEQHRI